MTVVIGERAPIVGRYLAALSYAPHEHLAQLQLRGTAIVFAPTLPDALRSPWAARRRGDPLSSQEIEDAQKRYGPKARVLAVYDSRLDALILPTTYRGRDLVWCVLHELGHALTMDLAWAEAPRRRDLLLGLPYEIARHLRDGEYEHPDGDTAVRLRVLEVLADSYVWLVLQRSRELPDAVTSALMAMLRGDELRPSRRLGV